VERPIKPTSIELSQNDAELKDPKAYPIKVHLKRLNATDEQSSTEVVNARFLVGTDGAHSWVRKNFGIQMEGEQTGVTFMACWSTLLQSLTVVVSL